MKAKELKAFLETVPEDAEIFINAAPEIYIPLGDAKYYIDYNEVDLCK